MTHIRVAGLARVEGEGGLEIVTAHGQVTEARLDIYEPPRFFEGLLRGRRYTEPPDITARICGICPVAYQMSACRAIEDACGVTVPEPVNALRRLLYCGEWIESHVLHIYLLHAPDFLGYESGIHMARDHPGLLERGLRLKKAGNRLIEVIGGRSVHPVNVRVGGFYRAPNARDLRGLAGELEWARQAALETVRWVEAFRFPDFSRDYEFVSLRDPAGYPVMGDRIVSSRGLDIPAGDYDENFTEFQVPHSTALHSVLDGSRTYMVGPMARYSMNSGHLPEAAASAAHAAGLGATCTNPFRSIIVRAVELVYACDEALRLIEHYEPPDPPSVDVPPAEATGYGCTEAPRGLLYHQYRITADGTITGAKIVPPTSQNQRVIETDLREFVGPRLDLPHDRLTWECEQAVRNYDPCISCSTHFLDLRILNQAGLGMRLGILCGGGPAPGMNSVISAATIEARNSGWDVLGIMDGFEHLIEGRVEEARPLSITDVSRIHVQGGSILRTSRANPTVRDAAAADPDWRLHACLESLRKLGVDALVTIGGDDTAFSASRLAEAAGGGLRMAHVPKTIDNDLPLPGGTPTFGFETARSVGVELVNNLMTDAITTQRWYLVVAMGRSAGHLALGIGKSAGATLTMIAEEFPRGEPIRLSRLVDVLESAMLKRIAHGRPFGVAVLAEGIGLRLPQDELRKAMPEVELDEHGHVRLAELELDRLLARQVKDRFKQRGQNVTVEGKNIGYELRCAPPIPFDIEYTRDLGYGAVDYLKRIQENGEPGGMITIQDGHMVPLPFGSFTDPETGRVRIRLVNVESSSYRVAREYMIRLDREDLEDPDRLRPIAAAAGLTPAAFGDRYGYLAED